MNILKSTLTLVIASAAWVSPTHAQAPGTASAGADTTPAEGVKKDARDEANALLRSKGSGWSPGYHKDTDRLIAVGSATIAVTAADAVNFGDARANAFEEAMLQAKKEFARALSMTVSAELSLAISNKKRGSKKPKPPSDAGQVSMGDKLLSLADSYIDGALEKQGIKPEEATEKQIKEVTNSKQFESGLKIAAAAELYGVYAWKIFEEITPGRKGKIAVIAMCTGKSKQMALAMLGKGEAPSGNPKTSNFDHLNALHDDGTLLYMFGVKQRTNDKGELCLLAFGQAAAEGDSDWDIEIAEGYADAAAVTALRMFAGEALIASADSGKNATIEMHADRSERYNNEKMHKENIKSVADTLSMPGAFGITYWKEIHPLLGIRIQSWLECMNGISQVLVTWRILKRQWIALGDLREVRA